MYIYIILQHFIMPNIFLFSHIYIVDGSGNEEYVHDFISELEVTSEVWIGLYQATPSDRFHWA